MSRRQGLARACDGTPEQIHLTWGQNPATGVVISWSSPGHAVRPRARIGQRVIPAESRPYIDEISGETVWMYHATVGGLRPGATYAYVVTADNDGNAADPFSATFRTAPWGRVPFRFTSFGDLATSVPSYGQSGYAVAAVESFQPLFHLLNGDLCSADTNPAVWRDFGDNNQASAAYRPWMPCPGHGPRGFASYLTRYRLPDNQVPGSGGRWYCFRVGSALFISLDAGAFGAQTAWLERTLAAGRGDASVDWIIVQVHQCAASSRATGDGSDPGIHALFDRYQVDLVLSGHDGSSPVRGADRDSGVFDTSQGTVHLILGRGATGSGIAVFDADPGPEGGDQASITVTQYHAVDAPTPDYIRFEAFTLVRRRV